MAKDFRASQIQTTQIIASGSSGTNAKIVVYPVEKQSGATPNQGIIDSNKFGTGSIGTDIFLFVSGGINERNTNNNSITVFGGDVHISGNLTSDQQIFGEGGLFRLEIVDFAITEQTSSNPKVVGQVIFPATEFTGSSLTLRAILSNTEGSGVAAIKLFNLTDLAFVEIAGPSQEELSVTGSTPTLVESVNLISASGFNTSSVGLYELQLFSSTGSNTAQVGGGELRPSGSFSGLTIVSSSTVINSDTWIDNNNRLRTTASVAIDSDGNFADEVGSNVYFYVSGTINSWTTASLLPEKNHAVFGGDVRVSGSFIGGSNNEILDDWPGGSIGSNTQFNFIAGGQNNSITPFTGGEESLGSERTDRNFIGTGIGNKITQSSDSAIIAGLYNEIGKNTEFSGSFIGAGVRNVLAANNATIVAGVENSSLGGERSFIGAGFSNVVDGEDSVVVGGENNEVETGARYSSIVAGYSNLILASKNASFIGAGQLNTVDGDQSAIVAGYNNYIDYNAQNSFIGTGQNNSINTSEGGSNWQAILVGSGNQIQDFDGQVTNYSVILGGQSNLIRSNASLIYGFDLTSSIDEGYTIQFGSRTNKASYRFVVSASRGAVFHGGLSGSHTALSDGSPAFLAQGGISLATQSNGAVVISSSLQASDMSFDSSTTGLSSSNVQDAIEELSGSIAADINSLFFPRNVLDNSGDRTLSDQDSGRVIFMNGTTTNYVRIPPTLSDGFSAILVQSSSVQVVVLSTSSLKYPSTTFKTGSAEQNSMLFVYSGSSGIFLGGDMELI